MPRRFAGVVVRRPGSFDMTVQVPGLGSFPAPSTGEGGGTSGAGGDVTEILEEGFTFGSEDFHEFYLDGAVGPGDVVWTWSQSNGGDVITERLNNVVLILSCFDAETVGTITVTATVGETVLTLEFDP